MPSHTRLGVSQLQPLMGQPGAPAAANTINELARQTEMLWMQTGGNVHSWHWPDPDTAPYCTVTAFNTETEFYIGDSTENTRFEIPWHIPDGFSRTGARLWIMGKAYGLAAQTRIKTDDLLAAVAVTSTYWRDCNFAAPANRGLWEEVWKMSQVGMACGPASLIASRYHAYHFAMRVATENANAWSNATTFDMEFRLWGLQLFDIPDDRDGYLDAGGE